MPHGNLDTNQEEIEANNRLYGFKIHMVNLKFMLTQKGHYCYILESLQYIYVRDYDRREVCCV